MKLYAKCEGCHKRKFLIRKRWITLPTGEKARSKKDFCTSCHNALKNLVSKA